MAAFLLMSLMLASALNPALAAVTQEGRVQKKSVSQQSTQEKITNQRNAWINNEYQRSQQLAEVHPQASATFNQSVQNMMPEEEYEYPSGSPVARAPPVKVRNNQIKELIQLRQIKVPDPIRVIERS